MKYPIESKVIIDVTKPPYLADNTGRTDSTAALRKAFDDCLKDYIKGFKELEEKLLALYRLEGKNVYVGAEAGKVIDGKVYMTMPERAPHTRILYFPKGTYLVSDTISYSFDNLSAQQTPTFRCEMCRNIHILGEDKNSTVIRLLDNARGFGTGSLKPLISFNTAHKSDKESTNCAQMNSLEDITLNLGKGNDGAVGVLFASSNCSRIENVSIVSDSSLYGIVFDYGSEGVVDRLAIHGFDYAIRTHRTSPIVFNNVDFSKNSLGGLLSSNGALVLNGANSSQIPLLTLDESACGRYFVDRSESIINGNCDGCFIFTEGERARRDVPTPKRSTTPSDWVSVDDFGAVGDGVTDSTDAIARAMLSGKPHIIFGEGTYLISRTVRIPATVRTVDFLYCSLVPGYSLLIGEMDAAFDICEDSSETFFAENFASLDEFEGFFRMFRHSAKRDVVLSDFMTASALYFNTVGGSRVYFDNCFTHTGHYSQDACLHRDGYTPVFCRMIPIELHGQEVYARNLNIERADVELLCDSSTLVIDGYKVEGPGTLISAIGGSSVKINLFNAAWWGNKLKDNAMLISTDSQICASGGLVHSFPEDESLSLAVIDRTGEIESRQTIISESIALKGKNSLGRSVGRLLKRLTTGYRGT